MKIIVVSDSHGRNDLLSDLVNQHPDADAFLHCGDIEDEADSFPEYLIVQGNNDYCNDTPAQRVLPFGSHRILLVHSHQFSYRRREEQMIELAKKYGCDIICFGHTHVADYRKVHGFVLLNPGSLKYSRDGRLPSYAILQIDGDQVDAEIVFLEPKKSKRGFFFHR